jgi:hypothetical protein
MASASPSGRVPGIMVRQLAGTPEILLPIIGVGIKAHALLANIRRRAGPGDPSWVTVTG